MSVTVMVVTINVQILDNFFRFPNNAVNQGTAELQPLASVFSVTAILGLDDHTGLEDFDRMPDSGRYLAAVSAFGRGEADASGLFAIVIVENLVQPSADADHAFG